MRARRNREARPGEDLQLYRGMRTKQCELIAVKTCAAVLRIFVCPQNEWIAVAEGYPWPGTWPIDDKTRANGFSYVDIEQFARRDGLAEWAEMREFWLREHPDTRQLTFDGVLIGR